MSASLLPLLVAVALVSSNLACNLCQPTPSPPGPCTGDSSCPAGDACLAGSCQSLTQVLQNLTAVLTPPTGDLAPQQYQPIDGTQSSLTLTLAAPQLWDFNLPIPPSCTPEEALPFTLRFTGKPIVPLLDWTFTFTTDVNGNVLGALPSGGTFDEWIAPATPCVAPIALTDNSLPGLAPLPSFADATATLTVVGAISATEAAETFGGASVTIKNVPLSSSPSMPLSGTVTTIGGLPGTLGFVLPVLQTEVTGSCAPLPVDTNCDGGSCLAADNCAQIILEVGPSAAQPLLPTIDLPITARYATAPSSDGGAPAGPILSLMGEDGLGVQLPISPAQLVSISGTVVQPGGQPLQFAEITLDCSQPDGGDLCAQGYSYRLTTLSGENGLGVGQFSIPAPPNGTYTITATPPPGLGLAPVSETVTVPQNASDAGVTAPTLQVPAGYQLSGTILDPTSTTVVTVGQVEATSLETGVLVGATQIQSQSGTFLLTLPPGQYMIVVHPDDSTGLPDRSEPVSLVGDLDLAISLYPGARLGGGVFAQPLDGGPFPVAQTTLQFYFITETQAFGTVALPIASGITDAQGHFSVAVPSSTATAAP
jgi:hypothetical protein